MPPRLPLLRASRHAGAIAVALSTLVGCGSGDDVATDDATSETGAFDTMPETVVTDVARDTEKRDAAVERVPKAPRCKPGDAGVPTDGGGADASSSDADAGADGGADADPDAPDAATDPDGSAPIPFRPVQVANSGGHVLRAPRIVPVTFDSDPNRLDVEDFVASVGCTPYWRAISSEYGIGDAIGGTPIHVAEAPPDSTSDSNIEKWLRTQLQAATPGWEAPTPDSLYVVFYPDTTRVRLGSSIGCEGFDGYHKSFTMPDGSSVAYAVVIDCGGDLDRVTGTTSHEIIEASTDPQPFADPTYLHVDDAHAVYGLFAGGEVGDLCSFDPRANFSPADYPFVVQRSWSNAASAARRDPCVPAQSGVYFNTWAELPDVIATNFSDPTAGVKIPVGGSRTILVHLYSDGPTDAWTVSARDAYGSGDHLSFKLDRTTGKDGDTIALTITKNSENDSIGAEPFMIMSSNGFGRRTVSYGLVGH